MVAAAPALVELPPPAEVAPEEPVEDAPPVAAPVPVAAPRPAKAPAAAPVVTAAPAAAPAATPAAAADPATAHVSVTGAVDRVSLTSGGKSYGPGKLKPGTYSVSVQFTGRSATQGVGTLTLAAGQDAVIACDAGFAMCKFK